MRPRASRWCWYRIVGAMPSGTNNSGKSLMTLSSLECRKLEPSQKPRKVSDGGGLHLLVKPNGSKLWRLSYRFDGKQKTLAFGSFPDVTLAEARRKRDAAKEVLASNRDPAFHSLPEEISDSFEMVAREWHKNQSRSWGLRHSETTLARLERDIFSQFGDQRISDIEAPTILQAIRKVESRGALDISKRLLNTVGAIFRYGIATGRASRDPAADLRGALKKSPRVKHMATIREAEIPEFLRRLKAYDGEETTKLAVEIVLHTFVRAGGLCQRKLVETGRARK